MADSDFPSDLRTLERDYELIRELGQGGMAAVYLARRRNSGRLVAIKAIRGRYVDDRDAVLRFAREARTVAGLDHPNIVHTEAIEQIDDRAVAIIMEHIPGGTVRDRLREYGALGAEDAEAILRDVANALRYAHRRGLVHRDVKPENIFLDVTRGRAVLSDFGIARKIDGDAGITLLGAALGTPQYMSPEQIDGEMVDGRSDIYSLGVLGWELLTGRRPWAGESLYGVIYKQKHEDLPRITSLRPRVPANLLFAIEGALMKNKAQRWQTVDAFLDQLTYNPPPVLAQPYPPGQGPVDDQPTVQFRSATLVPDAPAEVPAAHADVQTAPHSEVTAPIELEVSADPVALVAAPSEIRPLDATVSTGSDDRKPDVTAWDEPTYPIGDEPAGPFAPNVRPSFSLTPRRKRMLQALGLMVPLTIAAGSMFIILSGSARETARRNGGSKSVTSSAGTLASDSAAPPTTVTRSSGGLLAAPSPPQRTENVSGISAGSSVSAAAPNDEIAATPRKPSVARGTRTGGSATAKTQSRPRREVRVDTNRAVVSARPPGPVIDSSTSRPAAVPTPPSPDARAANEPPIDDPFKIPASPPPSSAAKSASPNAGRASGPSARCLIATTADQRACLSAYIEIGDEPLNRTFDSLVSEMRRLAGTPPGAPDPPTVQRIRVEQRVWLGVRDAECPRQAASGAGPFWAQAGAQCFTEMATARTAELRDAVHRLRRK